MARRSAWLALALASLLVMGKAVPTVAAEDKSLPPYMLIRSLQQIQDKVVRGDYSAAEMQRYLLLTIDKRLRTIDMAVFEDPRNVDAALIYAMSGGNPETLDILVDRDIAGNFDNRITSILRRYLKGKGGAVVKQLKDVVPEYRDTNIGPYLELIGANAVMATEPDLALKYFNWARVEAPGTLIEEAAIRRSLVMLARNNKIDEALHFSKLYARRFMQSPYATQFADIFVVLTIDHSDLVSKEDLEDILALMERRKQREIYLRLARRAAINGNRDLADFSSEKAKELSQPDEKGQIVLADLYAGIVNVPGADLEKVLEKLNAIKPEDLSPKDRFLKDAAEIVAGEVVRPPVKESLTQVKRTMVEKEYRDAMAEQIVKAGTPASVATAPVAVDPNKTSSTTPDNKDGASLEEFVSTGRLKLKEIDSMLSSEGQ